MKTELTLKAISFATMLLLVGRPWTALGQGASEMELLKSTVKAMEQTIQEMKIKIAELEKQRAVTPAASAAQSEAPVPGVPPATHPGAAPRLKAEAVKSDLAEETTQIPFQETMHEDQLSAPRSGNAPMDPSYKGFMQLFGTETWIRLGGYAKLDMIVDSTKVGNPNMFVTGLIPVEGETDYDKGEHFAMHAKQTRLNLELRSPTPIGSLKIYYENDFFNNNKESSMDYRLRHFYGQVANVTIGQTWSALFDADVFPDILDFEGPGILPVSRQPQVRYTLPIIKDHMHAAFSAEQPKSDIFNVPAGGDGRNTMPDFVAHWRWAGSPGHVQLGGVLRNLAYDNVSGGPTDSTMGWGLNLSGSLKICGEDSLLASFSYGDGMGRYVQDLPSGSAAVIDANGDLHTLTTYGGMLGYRHVWNEKWRSTVSYSYVKLDNEAEQGDFAYDQTHYAQGNLIWAPTKNFYVGIEYIYGLKEVRNGNEGDDHRVQLSFQYKLIR